MHGDFGSAPRPAGRPRSPSRRPVRGDLTAVLLDSLGLLEHGLLREQPIGGSASVLGSGGREGVQRDLDAWGSGVGHGGAAFGDLGEFGREGVRGYFRKKDPRQPV